jgi:hypothetical protein
MACASEVLGFDTQPAGAEMSSGRCHWAGQRLFRRVR